MKLYSTNDKNNIVDLKEAVLNAFPKDRGLYMPVSINPLASSLIKNIKQYSFVELGFHVAQNLIGDYISEENLFQIIDRAIDFSAPIVSLEKSFSTLELFHGPSMAFKDFGARFMAELMSYFLKTEDQKTTILVATSGDTGGAVAAGFYNVPNIDVKILYPSGKVSPLQEKQLTSWGSNISAVEIDGVFDDCQRLVKEAFIDDDLKAKYKFSSANSINIARLIPQSFYYFEGYKQVSHLAPEIIFSVPSGNFGNLTAGLMAKRMGLPIHKFLAATNINDSVPAYLQSGTYSPKASVPTISNAMDVGDPSNFSRMLELYENGSSTWNNLKGDVLGFTYTDKETVLALKKIKSENKYIADPHGAVAWLACKEYFIKNDKAHYVFLETAHPGKFSEVVESSIDEQLNLPHKLSEFLTKNKKAQRSSSSYKDFKDLLLSDS